MYLKRLILLCLAAVSLLVLTSCIQHEYLNLELPGGATQLSFEKEGGHVVLTLSSSSDWKAGSTPDWVVLGFTSGTSSTKSLKVSLWVNPNRGSDRSCEISFSNNNYKKVVVPIVQKGTSGSFDPGTDPDPEEPGDEHGDSQSTDYANAPFISIASFIVTANPEVYFKLSGTVSSFNSSTFEMTLTDETGSISVYEVLNKSEWKGRIHENGSIVISGKYHYYAGKRVDEVLSAYILSFTPAGSANEPIPLSIAEFKEAYASENQSYRLAGRMSNITNTIYGNFDLSDATGSVFIYGLTSTNLGYGTNNDKSFASLGLAEGDEIIIVGFRSNYNGQIEAKYSYFVEKTGSGVPVEPQPGEHEGEPTVTVDFRSQFPGFPQSNAEGLTSGTYEWSGYTFTLRADKFYQAKSDAYFLLIGKQNSYIQLPVIDGKALTGVKFLTAPQASENVIVDIANANGSRLMVNDSKLKKGTEYSWTFEGEKNLAYKILITNKYNAQFQYISLYYE